MIGDSSSLGIDPLQATPLAEVREREEVIDEGARPVDGWDKKYTCVKDGSTHFGKVDAPRNMPDYCMYCDGPGSSKLLAREAQVFYEMNADEHPFPSEKYERYMRDQALALGGRDEHMEPWGQTLDELRASVPRPWPRRPLGVAGTPMGVGVGGRVNRFPDLEPMGMPEDLTGVGYDDIDEQLPRPWNRPGPASTAGMIRPRRVRLRDTIAYHVTKWAIGKLEEYVDLAYDTMHELALRTGQITLADLPNLHDYAPLTPMTPMDFEIPQYPEEVPFANNPGGGIFDGGIGKVR